MEHASHASDLRDFTSRDALVRQDSWETQAAALLLLLRSSFQTQISKMCAWNGLKVNTGQSARVYLWLSREVDELGG